MAAYADIVQAWEGPAILLVDLDAFFASVEQLDHPAWRGKPVIVGGSADAHGVVSTASYEARAFGVKSAMPASTARRLCPDAIWTRGHFDRYREMSNQVMAILRDETPLVQQVSIDEAFMDVSPTRVNTEHPIRIAERIQERVAKLGVSCSVGLGTTKTIAKIASDIDKPRGLTVVFPGREADFLKPLPVRAMSGVGAAAERELRSHGVKTLGDMAQADDALLRKIFGKNAGMMRARALGGDAAPIVTDSEVKSVSNETTFARDLTHRADIEAAIAAMASKVGRRLRKKGLKGQTLTLKLRFSDRSIHTAQCRLEQASDDELEMTPTAYRLLDQIWRDGFVVRLLGIGVSGFCHDELVQESLFDASSLEEDRRAPVLLADSEKRKELLRATDMLKNRFGEDAVRFGSELRNAGNTTGTSAKNPEDYK